MSTDCARTRWPVFTAEARSVGVHAVFAFAITSGTRPLGVLELYRRSAGDLSPGGSRAAALCAESIATTIAENWDAVTARLAPGGDTAAESAEWLAADELLHLGVNFRRRCIWPPGWWRSSCT